MIQGYVEVRHIPVLQENALDILQPGWSRQYQEEREKIQHECEVDEDKRQKRLARKAVMEIEMKEMASEFHDGLTSEFYMK